MVDGTIYISNIQRFCVHDGPGIRTIAFVVGCPLKCKWCQNPETLSGNCELMLNKALCTGCGLCIDACPNGCIQYSENGAVITDRQKCNQCFECVEACPFQARQVSCKAYTIDTLFKELNKDEIFFKNTEGGITISGGEPMLQTNFCFELLYRLKQKNIHTAIETSGFTKWKNFKKISSVVDLFLYDIKLFSSDKHMEWTGQDNTIILENLGKLVDLNKNIIVRVPLIPGVNDGDEFKRIIDYISQYQSISEIHILPFHQMGSSKYGMLGKEYLSKNISEDNFKAVELCQNYAKVNGYEVSIGGSGL